MSAKTKLITLTLVGMLLACLVSLLTTSRKPISPTPPFAQTESSNPNRPQQPTAPSPTRPTKAWTPKDIRLPGEALPHLAGDSTEPTDSLVDRYYPEADVVHQSTRRMRRMGYSQRVTVVETDLVYPLVRVEDTLLQQPGAEEPIVVRSVAMAADHAVVDLSGTDSDAVVASLREQGYTIRKSLAFSDGVLVEYPAGSDPEAFHTILSQIDAQVGDAAVAEPDFLVYPSVRPSDPYLQNDSLWGMDNRGQSGGKPGADISATEAWDVRNNAATVIVGVVDTGIRATHQDLAANIWRNPGETAGNNRDDDGNGVIDDWYGYDAIDDGGNPDDGDGHGTHVAGTIGAVGNNGIGVTGVAWRVQLMSLRFLTSQGGFTSDAIEAIDYARQEGAHILNNSWGGGGYSASLLSAISRAESAGMLFVVAAGNDNSNNDNSPSYPASYTLPSIVSVASSDRNDLRSSFSNYGAQSVDLAAPGSAIVSTYHLANDSYATLSGTSMASPCVAGAAALLKAEFPFESALELKDRLLNTSDLLSSFSGITTSGGRLNLAAALNYQATPRPGVLSFAAAATEVVENAGDIAVIVNRTGGAGGAVSIRYNTQSGTAGAGSDYTAASGGTLSWADGDESERIINIPILDDELAEGLETFSISLSSPTGGAELGINSTVTITILDNEFEQLEGLDFERVTDATGRNFYYQTPEPDLAIGPGVHGWTDLIVQGEVLKPLVRQYRSDGGLQWERTLTPAGTVYGAFQPRIAYGADGRVYIAYSRITRLSFFGYIQDTDLALAAYSSDGTLLWDKLIGSATSDIDLPEDIVVAADGSIYIGGVADIGGVEDTLVVKVNSLGNQVWRDSLDLESSSTVSDEITSLDIDSFGNIYAGGSSILSGGYTGIVLKYQPDGTRVFTKTFPNVERQRVISLTINHFDELYLGLRTFNPSTLNFNAKLMKVSPFDGGIIWQRAESIGNVYPNFKITTDLNGNVFFVEGSEDLWQDYRAYSIGQYDREGTKVFESSLNANTPITINALTRGNSAGDILLTGSYYGTAQFGGTFLNSGGSAAVYLASFTRSTPADPGQLSFAIDRYSAFEKAGSVEISIRRDVGFDGEVSIDVSTDTGSTPPSATAGIDYVQASAQTVTFMPGQQFATFEVELINDFATEPDETFDLVLTNPTGGASLGSISRATFSITNDDFEFEEWLSDYFTEAQLADPAISADTADPDGDGFSNIQEYGFGLDPSTTSTNPGPFIEIIDQSNLLITHAPFAPRDDLLGNFETSENAEDWTIIPADQGTTTGAGTPAEQVEYLIDISSGSGKGFFRVNFQRDRVGF